VRLLFGVSLVFLVLYRRERRSCPSRGFLSLSHSDWGDDFYTRARSRYIHRHMHRFDSMCTFDFNKSALELSFFVVARGFVLSWVGCLSSLSLSTESNERTNAQKREKRVLSLTSSSLASRIFLLSSSDLETRKYLLFFFFPHRIKGLSRGGGRYRR
jgi:hypothetical protein